MGQGIVAVLNISKKLTGLLWSLVYLKSTTTPAAVLSYPSASWSSLGTDLLYNVDPFALVSQQEKNFQNYSCARTFFICWTKWESFGFPYLPLISAPIPDYEWPTGIFAEFLSSWTLACAATHPPCWATHHTEQCRQLCSGDGSRLQD